MPKLTLSNNHTKFVCGFCGADCIADTDPAAVMHYLQEAISTTSNRLKSLQIATKLFTL